jgi:hypothetical protein
MPEIRIGKTVIETLTSGMYEDARFVYREYIQNAADQIDKAVELGILENRNDGKIHLSIDAKEKRIIIEDNATGIKSDEFFSILANIALSTKDRTKDKGFRGIGRLGGLGYCRKLIFETTFKGENVKSIMTWDAENLQQKLNDHKLDLDAASVVNSVIKTDYEAIDKDEHFFKVILENVTNTDLLCRNNIIEYLSMVAPVPYEPHFIFKNKIYDELKKEGLSIDEYYIFINTDRLFKAYSSTFYDLKGTQKYSYDDVFDIDTFKITNSANELVAWAWFGLSRFDKQIPAKGNIARGIRLRKGNIQIGSENTLVKLHKEQRGNFYFIGEVHGFHHELIPNSRRDYFNENNTSKLLDNKLKELFHVKLYKLYHDANKLKNAIKKIDSYNELKADYQEKLNNGNFSSKQQENNLMESLEKARTEANNKSKDLNRFKEKAETDTTLSKIYEKIVRNEIHNNVEDTPLIETNDGKTKYRTQKLSRLDRKQEKVVRRIFEIIDLMLPDLKDRGEELKQKIEEEFK